MDRWPLRQSYFWEEAPFLRLLLPLIAGIVLYEKIRMEFSLPSMVIIIVVLVGCVLAFSFFKISNTALRWVKFIFIQCTLVGFGWVACFAFDERNDLNWFGNYLDRATAFTAEIAANPVEKEKTWKLVVEMKNVVIGNSFVPVKGQSYVYVYKQKAPIGFSPGQSIILPAKWQPIKNAGNPFEFDYASFLRHQNIFYQQFLAEEEIVVVNMPARKQSIIAQVHDWSMRQLEHHVFDSATLGLMQAMLLGDEVNLDNDLRQAYADTGIVHYIAISGGHLVIFFSIINALLFWIRNKKYQWVKYTIAVPFIWMYVVIAGAPHSAVRAAMMFTGFAIGLSLQKNSNSINQLFFTAFVILLFYPFWFFSVGFQLSCVAVLSIILFYPRIHRLCTPSGKITRFIWGLIAVSLAAEILVAPLVAFYFHLFPITFLVANVFAWLFMTAVLVAGLLIILFSKIAVIADGIAWVVTKIVGVFNSCIEWLQQFNPEAFKHIYFTGVELIFIYALTTSIALYFIQKKKELTIVSLGLICVLLSFSTIRHWKALHQQQLVIYNTSGFNYAELIEGKTYIPILQDSLENSIPKKDYASKDFHTAIAAWKEKQRHPEEIYKIGNKTVVILNKSLLLDTSTKFHTNYVLINYPVKECNALMLQKTFNCEKIILGGGQKRFVAQNWKDSCERFQIPLHAVAFDGAFIIK